MPYPELKLVVVEVEVVENVVNYMVVLESLLFGFDLLDFLQVLLKLRRVVEWICKT